MKLTGKISITGHLVTVTGLHVGGSKSSLDIGGIDLNVLKDAHGLPFIPGSSLKGKLRSLLAKNEGSTSVEKDSETLCEIFGLGGDGKNRGFVTRLIVRDAQLNLDEFEKTFADKELEFEYTESKWENTIDRVKGTAMHPRQLERVPAGAVFNFSMVYDVYDDGKDKIHLDKVIEALRLLEDDYIGGSGSRGYGRITFQNVTFEERSIEAFYRRDKGHQQVKKLDQYKL